LLALDHSVRGGTPHTGTQRYAGHLRRSKTNCVASIPRRRHSALMVRTERQSDVTSFVCSTALSTFCLAIDLLAHGQRCVRASRSALRNLAGSFDRFSTHGRAGVQTAHRLCANAAVAAARSDTRRFHVTTTLGINLRNLAVVYDSPGCVAR